jgi:hypothetical protein
MRRCPGIAPLVCYIVSLLIKWSTDGGNRLGGGGGHHLNGLPVPFEVHLEGRTESFRFNLESTLIEEQCGGRQVRSWVVIHRKPDPTN